MARLDLCPDLRSEIDSGKSEEDVATDEFDESRFVCSGLNFKNQIVSTKIQKARSFIDEVYWHN
jgi:hypothetical protein